MHPTFCLQTLAGLADNTPKSVVDSLLTQLETLPHDTTRLELLQKLALASQNSSRSLEFADRFFKEAQQQKDDYYICNAAYFHVLHYYNNEGEQDSVAKWVNLIKPIAQDIKYWKFISTHKGYSSISTYTITSMNMPSTKLPSC